MLRIITGLSCSMLMGVPAPSLPVPLRPRVEQVSDPDVALPRASLPVLAAAAEGAASSRAVRSARPPGHAYVVSGVALVVASTVAYALVGAGLIIGQQAEARLVRLHAPSDLEQRRDTLALGRTGNQMAIGAGLSAVALMGAGIPLIVFGRRRAKRALAEQP